MNKSIEKLQAERVDLLAILADTRARAGQLERAIEEAIAILEENWRGGLAQTIREQLRAALENEEFPQ